MVKLGNWELVELGISKSFFMKKIELSCLFVALASLLSCNTKQPIDAEVYVRYMADEQAYQSEMSLRSVSGDKKVKEVEVQDLFFIDGAMEKKQHHVKGLIYKSESNGAWVSPIVFKGKMENDKPFNLSLELVPITQFKVKEPQISSTNGFNLVWEGVALSKEESLTILVNDEIGITSSINIKGPTASNETFVASSNLASLGRGQGTMSIVKQRMYEPKTDGVATKATLEYYSKTQSVLIGE